MDMELSLITRILWRWKWLILACVLTAGVAVWLGISNTVPVYRATAILQFTAPDRQGVEIDPQYKFVSEREEIVQAVNNFVSAAQQTTVYDLTRAALDLNDSVADYEMEVKASVDSDYVELSTENDSPFLAESLVNTHVKFAIQQYGVLRSQSTEKDKETFKEQLTTAEADLKAAEEEFNQFRADNGITFLDTEIKLVESMMVNLQAEQSSLISRDPVGQSPQVVQLESRMATNRARLEMLSQLEAEYSRLQSRIDELRETYQRLLSVVSEAEIKQEIARRASFIQVAAPALVPLEPEDRTTRLILLALIGSLGIGILLAFVLEYSTGAPLAQEYKIAREVRSILSDEQLLGTRALVKQIQEKSSMQGDSFDFKGVDEKELIIREREIELQRRQAEVN